METNQERKVKLMSVSCQHPHEIVYTPKGKSFFICFSTCLLTFQTQTVKECRLCFKAKRAICHFFIRFVSKIHVLEGGRTKEKSAKSRFYAWLYFATFLHISNVALLFLLLKVSNSRKLYLKITLEVSFSSMSFRTLCDTVLWKNLAHQMNEFREFLASRV